MSRNWLRSCLLSCGGTTVNGGGPTDLRIRFNIESHTLQSPDQACFIVTNPSKSTVAAFQQEFAEVTFKAGYEDNSGQIFKGSIIQSMYGEIEELTDRLLRLYCANGDLSYNNTHVSTTLAAGSTPQDIVNACVQAMGQYGVTMGRVVGVDLSQPKFPRGYPLFGMARDHLRDVALSKNATYCINPSNQIDIIGKNASTSDAPIQINASSGMIGQAIQTIEGVRVKTLINPAITVNSNIQLNPSTVVSPIFSGTIPLQTNAQDQFRQFANQLNPTGLYRILHILCDGDTRGNDYTQTLTCLGLGQELNSTQVGLGYQ